MPKSKIGSFVRIDERLLHPQYEDYCQPHAFEPTTENDFCAILVNGEKELKIKKNLWITTT